MKAIVERHSGYDSPLLHCIFQCRSLIIFGVGVHIACSDEGVMRRPERVGQVDVEAPTSFCVYTLLEQKLPNQGGYRHR